MGQCHLCISNSTMFSSISGLMGKSGVQKGQESGVLEPEALQKIGISENTLKYRKFKGSLWFLHAKMAQYACKTGENA